LGAVALLEVGHNGDVQNTPPTWPSPR
jgi:hypothetical protein